MIEAGGSGLGKSAPSVRYRSAIACSPLSDTPNTYSSESSYTADGARLGTPLTSEPFIRVGVPVPCG